MPSNNPVPGLSSVEWSRGDWTKWNEIGRSMDANQISEFIPAVRQGLGPFREGAGWAWNVHRTGIMCNWLLMVT